MPIQKIRVLHVYKTYYPDPPGGLQEAIRQIAMSSAQFEIESRVFTLSPIPDPEVIIRSEASVVRCKSWIAPASCDLGGLSSLCKFSELVKWADVINYHFPWPFADFLHLIIQPAIPAVMTYHADIVRQRFLGKVYFPIMSRMLIAMSAVVSTSPAYAKTSPILSDASLADRINVIPLGIVESTYPKGGEEQILNNLCLDDGRPYFLFIGVLRYYKGLHSLIDAAASLRARVVIAGSGPEEHSLKNKVDNLHLSNVVFAGQISDLEKIALLKNCRALVLPSHLRSEAFGMVLVEAAMFSKPMISCEIGTGTSFVNIHEETGIVVPPESSVDLALAMNLLTDDTNLALAYGKAARARYEEKFSGDALGKAYSDLYKTVVNCK